MLYRGINTEWLVNIGFVYVVLVHTVSYFSLKAPFLLAMLSHHASPAVTEIQFQHASRKESFRLTSAIRRAGSVVSISPIIFLLLFLCTYISGFTLFQKSSCCTFVRLLVRALYFVWLNGLFLYKSFSSH